MNKYDTIILGSSPNALVAAAYLAKAKQRVLVLEPSDTIGGAVSTAEFAPGYRADVSFLSGRINAAVAKDLNLNQYGLETIERESITGLLPDGRSFTLPKDRKAAVEVISKFAPADATRYEKFMALLDLAAEFLSSVYESTPPQQHPPSASEAMMLSSLVGKLKGFGRRETTEVMRLLVMPVRDLLDEWFENAELKGLLAGVAVRGLTRGSFAGSTTFNLLHHLAIGDAYFRASAKGGVGAISLAIAAAAKAAGAELRTGTGDVRVAITEGIATGVQLNNDEVINADAVFSDFDAFYTFTKLVPPPELDPEFNRSVRTTRYKGSVARIDFALSELPQFANVSKDAMSGTLVLSPSVAYLERGYDAAKYGGISENPYLEITIPSVSDDSMAPPGSHVMSVWFQFAPCEAVCDQNKLVEITLNILSKYAPNLRTAVKHSAVTTAKDFQSKFNLTEGQLYGGELNLAQAFYLRPIPGFAHYQTPIAQLFMCGAATHPGGGVSGLSGKNAVAQPSARPLALAAKD